MKELCLNTFGKEKIHIHLAEELNRLGDIRHKRVVGKIITQLKMNLASINPKIDKKQKLLFYNLIKDYTFKTIDESVILKDTVVINFLRNVVTAILRTYLRENT